MVCFYTLAKWSFQLLRQYHSYYQSSKLFDRNTSSVYDFELVYRMDLLPPDFTGKIDALAVGNIPFELEIHRLHHQLWTQRALRVGPWDVELRLGWKGVGPCKWTPNNQFPSLEVSQRRQPFLFQGKHVSKKLAWMGVLQMKLRLLGDGKT